MSKTNSAAILATLRTLATETRSAANAGDYAKALRLTTEIRAIANLISDPWALLMTLTYRDRSAGVIARALSDLPGALRMLDRSIDFWAEDMGLRAA